MRRILRRIAVLMLLFVFSTLCAAFALAGESKAPNKSTVADRRDLQGTWTAGILTPIERPAELGDKAFFTPNELVERQRQSTQRFWEAGHRPGEVGRDNDAFLDNDLQILQNGQTSLVVDPRDGKVPLTATAEQRRDFNLKNFDSYETMSQWDRCITRQPTALFPVNYNNAYQIVQTPTHIVLVSEMIHDARVIPLDNTKHIDARIRNWSGDPRAHWEGNTLVIDTTNFNDQGWIATGGSSGRLRGVPYSKNLHIVERLTRVDANTLAYEIIVDDPEFYRAPWKMSYPLKRDDSYRMFEYACHEDNQAIEAILRGARVQEKAAAAAK
jgi:hypothetical protein